MSENMLEEVLTEKKDQLLQLEVETSGLAEVLKRKEAVIAAKDGEWLYRPDHPTLLPFHNEVLMGNRMLQKW